MSVGVRNISAEEVPFLEAKRERVHVHWAKDKTSWNIAEIVAPLAGKAVYLTFDLDCFDSSLMPATGTPEQCVAAIEGQLALGCDGVILHGASPAQLEPIVAAYRKQRPAGRFDQKREDALLMLRVMRDSLKRDEPPLQAAYHFEHTTLWEQAARMAAQRDDQGIAT